MSERRITIRKTAAFGKSNTILDEIDDAPAPSAEARDPLILRDPRDARKNFLSITSKPTR